MYLLTVIPISRGIFKDTLHYFTKENAPLGSLVSVPVRKKSVRALVTDVENVGEKKAEIKSYPYKIKKIEEIYPNSFFTPEYIKTVNELSDYYAGHTGQVLALLTPQKILENISTVSKTKTPVVKSKKENLLWEGALVSSGSDEDRLSLYKSKIREAFAKNTSVFFCLPTILDVERALGNFEKGIQDYTITFHSKLTKKETISRWEKASSMKHPVLIIGTPPFISIPRPDIMTYILDKENSPAYKALSRPFIDYKKAIQILAESRRASLIVGDTALKTETVYEKESGRCHPLSNIKYRILSTPTTNLIDITKERKKEKEDKKPFKIISEELRLCIDESLKNNDRVFIFANRKGLSPYTTCSDCGHTLNCERCRTPLVLYKNRTGLKPLHIKENEKTFYLCHACSELSSSSVRCPNCKGWRLTPLGIGIESVEEELKKLFPDTEIFRIDKDTAKTAKSGLTISNHFSKSPGSILLGTEMAFFYLNEKIESSAIISIDSLFAIPDYRVRERIVNILTRAKLLSTKNFLIQTRNPDWSIFSYIAKGNLLDFYKEEVEFRKKFSYPPFSTLIKITREDSPSKVWKEMNALEKKLKNYNPFIYPAFREMVRNKERVNILIKFTKKWPDSELLKILRELPLSFKVDINPREIL